MFEPLNTFWGKDAHMLHTGMSIEGFNFIALLLLCLYCWHDGVCL
jgi:hypothetical protein